VYEKLRTSSVHVGGGKSAGQEKDENSVLPGDSPHTAPERIRETDKDSSKKAKKRRNLGSE